MYCVSCKKNTMNKNSSVRRTKQNRLMLVLNCAICSKKKLRFITNQEASKLLNKLGIRTPLSNITLIGDILFYGTCFVLIIVEKISLKMNGLVNKFVSTGDKFMRELHLRQPGFICSSCRPFTKTREKI